jgi:ribosomal protein S18 acetylase RimI-like enzyme
MHVPSETSAQTVDGFSIRAYVAENWPAVCGVHDRARPDELKGSCDPRGFVPLADEKEDASNFARSRKFVACGGDRVVGFVGVDGKFVSWLYVDPDFYGRGIGRRLLRLAIRLIGSDAWTVALAGNTRAQRLYESEGFRVVETFEGDNAGYPCMCLKLAIPASPESGSMWPQKV